MGLTTSLFVFSQRSSADFWILVRSLASMPSMGSRVMVSKV